VSLIAVNNIIVVAYQCSKCHQLSLSLIAVNETPLMGEPYSHLKSKVGHILAKATDVRINLNIDEVWRYVGERRLKSLSHLAYPTS
jgi:hypothetical protein